MQSNAILYATSDEQYLPYNNTQIVLFLPKLKLAGSVKVVSRIWILGKTSLKRLLAILAFWQWYCLKVVKYAITLILIRYANCLFWLI